MHAEIMQPRMTRKPSKPLTRELSDVELIAAMYDTRGDDVLRKEEYRLSPQNRTCKSYGLRERESTRTTRARKPQPVVNRPFANCW